MNYILTILIAIILYYSVVQICGFFGIGADEYSPYINFYIMLLFFAIFLPLQIEKP